MFFGLRYQRVHSPFDGFVVGKHRFPFTLNAGRSRLGVGCIAEESLELSEVGRREVEFWFLGVLVALVHPP